MRRPPRLRAWGSESHAECSAELAAQGIGERSITRHLRAHIRYAGTDTLLSVEAQLSPSRRRRGAA